MGFVKGDGVKLADGRSATDKASCLDKRAGVAGAVLQRLLSLGQLSFFSKCLQDHNSQTARAKELTF